MRTLAQDLTPEMETQLIRLLRTRSPAQKLKRFSGLWELARQLMLSDIRAHFPQASPREWHRQMLLRRLGREKSEQIFSKNHAPSSREAEMNEIQIIVAVTQRLEALNVPYFITGGIASITYGEPRLTDDADLVIRIFPFAVPRLVAAFESDFLVSLDSVNDAVAQHYAFNFIHIATGFRIDFYPISDDDDLDIDSFARRQRKESGAGEVWMASAEDVILAKLRWFKKGGKVSEQQWRDVLGVLKVQGPRLDFAYLTGQAQRFGLADLLERAREEAGEISAT
ncbi:hypothetical protein HUU05_08265 [candidate division KSB1 bacterium]|nr:hypothetical protein [candidate division KSB1 bacterium]